MINWLRYKLALWGWFAFEHTKRNTLINAGEHRTVRVGYTYNGDVEIAVSNNTPNKLIATLKVSYPDQNNIEFKNFLDHEDSLEPIIQTSEDTTT